MIIMSDLHTTPGDWYIRPTFSTIVNDHLTIASTHNNGEVIATIPPRNGKPNYGDAALMASSKEILDALIELQELANAKENISSEDVLRITSEAFEKIHAEVE